MRGDMRRDNELKIVGTVQDCDRLFHTICQNMMNVSSPGNTHHKIAAMIFFQMLFQSKQFSI